MQENWTVQIELSARHLITPTLSTHQLLAAAPPFTDLMKSESFLAR